MPKHIPPLNALRAFEAASRLGSFVKAGQELHVTAAAISHQIKLLEHWLGLKLFERNARGVVLNANGLEYASRIREAFDRLMMTTVAARANRSKRVITVRCQFSVASMWLVPRLHRFQETYPHIELKVMADATNSLSPKVEADLSIYFLRTDLANYAQTPLLPYELTVFASPAILRGRNPTPSQVLQSPLLHNTLEDRNYQVPNFDDWFAACGIKTPPIMPGLRFNLLYLSAQACMQGLGFALLPVALCDELVRNGQLTQVTGPTLPLSDVFHIAHKKRIPEDVQLVRDWLIAQSPLCN